MHLFFLRHGEAEERRPGLRDADRHLTPEGIAEMQMVAAGLAALDVKVDRVLSSPLPRALETAQIAAEALGISAGSVVTDARLEAGAFRLGSLQSLLETEPRSARLLLVGHEPDFSMVVGQLVGGAAIEFKKAGLARVEIDRVEPGHGVLRWLLTPQILALLARS
jgi:phosphohistidine phosphatase